MMNELESYFHAITSSNTFDEVRSLFPTKQFSSKLSEIMEVTQSNILRNKHLMVQLASRLYIDLLCQFNQSELLVDFSVDLLLTFCKDQVFLLYYLEYGHILSIAYTVRFRNPEYCIIPVAIAKNEFETKVTQALKHASLPHICVSGLDTEGNLSYLYEIIKDIVHQWQAWF